jgi:hypothetical protein
MTVAKACYTTFGLEIAWMKDLATGAGGMILRPELIYLLEVTGIRPKVFGFFAAPLSNNDDTFG